MTRVHVSDIEDTVWEQEAIVATSQRHPMQRNHILAATVLGIVIAFALGLSLSYGPGTAGNGERLLATKSCEGCDLERTHLVGACLSRANLRSARLKDADLSVADLSHADLSQADLSNVSLYGANLSGADLRGGQPQWRPSFVC